MVISLLILVLFCTILAFFIQERSKYFSSTLIGIKKDWQIKVIFIIMTLCFIIFSALRTGYNDTSAYMHAFDVLDTDSITISCLLKPYGGFDLYRKILKDYLAENSQILIIVSTVICVCIAVRFITIYSETFGSSIYIYAFCDYIFSMAGMKQAIAIAISLFFIENILKRRYIIAYVFLALAATFHPYIICLAIIPFLKDDILGIKTVLILACTVFMVLNLDKFLNLVATIGKEYNASEFYGNTINPFRVVIESIPIVIIVVFRKELTKEKDTLLNMGLNMRIVSFTCLALGLVMDPVYMGRISSYFGSISAVAIPKMLNVSFKNQKYGSLLKNAFYLIFTVYWILDLTKFGSIGLLQDLFHHISFGDIFKIF